MMKNSRKSLKKSIKLLKKGNKSQQIAKKSIKSWTFQRFEVPNQNKALHFLAEQQIAD